MSEAASSPRRRKSDVFFGRRLRELRRESGLSQETLALGVGLSRHEVGAHERGLRSIEPARLVQYGQFLAVKLSSFVQASQTNQQECLDRQ